MYYSISVQWPLSVTSIILFELTLAVCLLQQFVYSKSIVLLKRWVIQHVCDRFEASAENLLTLSVITPWFPNAKVNNPFIKINIITSHRYIHIVFTSANNNIKNMAKILEKHDI